MRPIFLGGRTKSAIMPAAWGGSGPALLLLMRGDDWPDDQLVDREISGESGAEGDEAVSNEFDQVVLN